MTSFLRRISDFFAQVFSFGRELLSSPFFEHVFTIAGLLYPPAVPIIEEHFTLWGQPVTSPAQVPDCLANFAVEACYANLRLSAPGSK